MKIQRAALTLLALSCAYGAIYHAADAAMAAFCWFAAGYCASAVVTIGDK